VRVAAGVGSDRKGVVLVAASQECRIDVVRIQVLGITWRLVRGAECCDESIVLTAIAVAIGAAGGLKHAGGCVKRGRRRGSSAAGSTGDIDIVLRAVGAVEGNARGEIVVSASYIGREPEPRQIRKHFRYKRIGMT